MTEQRANRMGAGPAAVSRRRALAILGAAAGLPLVGAADAPGAADPRLAFEWRGRALGAPARLVLAHPERARARDAVNRCLDEVARLERIFSLHLAESELVRLNRAGRLDAPSHDLRLLLAAAQRFGALSAGAFDVTVQPLWRLYADHFADARADPAGPPAERIEAVRTLVDYRAIDLDAGRVRLARPGMAVTLNGIAQGYITDRVADILRDTGFERVLAQLGETRALARPGQPPWRIGIPDPRDAGRLRARLELANAAVATSSGWATRFDVAGRHHHLIDPARGTSAHSCLSATVVGPDATTADAMSTALAIGPVEDAGDLLRDAGAERALIVLTDGRLWTVTACARRPPCVTRPARLAGRRAGGRTARGTGRRRRSS